MKALFKVKYNVEVFGKPQPRECESLNGHFFVQQFSEIFLCSFPFNNK